MEYTSGQQEEREKKKLNVNACMLLRVCNYPPPINLRNILQLFALD